MARNLKTQIPATISMSAPAVALYVGWLLCYIIYKHDGYVDRLYGALWFVTGVSITFFLMRYTRFSLSSRIIVTIAGLAYTLLVFWQVYHGEWTFDLLP